jgi:hypothetical protein
MSIDTRTLIWLFPVAFMFHDFEEITFWEPWLNKHGDEVKRRVPGFLAKHVAAIVGKSTTQLTLPIFLIFGLTALSSFLAAEFDQYGLFLAASGLFFIHGFMHLGQAIALRRYVPAVITSALIVIPYGLVLFWRLTSEGIVGLAGLFIYFLLGAVLMVPFILVMHTAGEYLYKKAVSLLVP